jgi:hypothetical protein
MMKVQARMLVPAWKRLRAAQALSSVSWHEIVGQVAAARQRAAEGAQVRDDLRELSLNSLVRQRHGCRRYGPRLPRRIRLLPSCPREIRVLKSVTRAGARSAASGQE